MDSSSAEVLNIAPPNETAESLNEAIDKSGKHSQTSETVPAKDGFDHMVPTAASKHPDSKSENVLGTDTRRVVATSSLLGGHDDKSSRRSPKISLNSVQVNSCDVSNGVHDSNEPKALRSKHNSRGESGMSMTEDEAKTVLQDFLKGKSRTSDKVNDNLASTTEAENAEYSAAGGLPPVMPMEENNYQIDNLVERIVDKLKPYLNPAAALGVIDEKDEEQVEDVTLTENGQQHEVEKDDDMKEETASTRNIKTADKVQNVLHEMEKLRHLIEVGRSLSRNEGHEDGNKEKEVTNVILALKRKESKLSSRMKEVEQRVVEIKSKKEILEKKEEDVERHVRELVENTNRNEEKRIQLEEKELEIDERLEDAKIVTRQCKSKENDILKRETIISKRESDIREKVSDLERREKHLENEKRQNTEERKRLKAMEERIQRKERELKNDEQRGREMESEIKMKEIDIQFRLEDSKRKHEDVKRRMEELEDENEKLERVLRKIQTEKRRFGDDFRSKHEELTDLSGRVRKFMNDWKRQLNNKIGDDKGHGRNVRDKSLESAISDVESERRLLELETEIVEQQLDLERKGRLLLEQDKVLAELGFFQQDDGGPLGYKRKENTRLPPLGNKLLHRYSAERQKRDQVVYPSLQDVPGEDNRSHDGRRDSLNLESIKSDDDGEDGDDTEEDEYKEEPRQLTTQFPFSFVFSLHSPGCHIPEVLFQTKEIKTIRDLKMALKKQEGIPIGWQKFYSNAHSLSDTTLLQRISGNTQLRLTLNRGNKVMTVSIPDGEKKKVAFDLEETVKFSKIRIFQATGLFPSQMQLFISGSVMRNKDVLGDFCKGGLAEVELVYAD